MSILILGLIFRTKDPNGVGDTVHMFLFPYLSHYKGSKDTMLARRWDKMLDRTMLTIYTDTVLLSQSQKIVPIKVWETAV